MTSHTVLQAADSASWMTSSPNPVATPRLHGYTACCQAVKHTLCIHLMCNICKWAVCFYAQKGVACNMLIFAHQTQPKIYCLAVLLLVNLLVCRLAQLCRKTFRPDGVVDQLTHDNFMRTFALGFAAAQASSLLCVDWATSFYAFVLVVPLLSKHSYVQDSTLHLLLNGFAAVSFAVIVVFSCFLVMANTAFVPLLQSLQSGIGSLPDILSRVVTSWDTSCLGAVLTLITPVCLIKFS